MALRLTADARLQFCLLREDIAIDLRPHIGVLDGMLEQKIADALAVYDTAEFQENLVSQKNEILPRFISSGQVIPLMVQEMKL